MSDNRVTLIGEFTDDERAIIMKVIEHFVSPNTKNPWCIMRLRSGFMATRLSWKSRSLESFTAIGIARKIEDYYTDYYDD